MMTFASSRSGIDSTPAVVVDIDYTTTRCDGFFLIFDTARQGGWPVSLSDIVAHMAECDDCRDAWGADT